MPTFIETCNCRGTRPTKVVGKHFNSRPNLVGELLKDRNVPRFIIAPAGYGKSVLAYEYANIMFAFKHVFWIRCTSPCFIRDLDSDGIASEILKVDPDASLVVWEDVPSLDGERSTHLNSAIEGLLEHGCESIVTTTPASDTFSHHRLDCIKLNSDAMLLTDEELDLEKLRGNFDGSNESLESAGLNIPALIWGQTGERDLIEGISNEDLPNDIKVVSFAALAIGHVSTDALTSFVKPGTLQEILDILQTDYHFLGIDSSRGELDPIDVPVSVLSEIYKSKIAGLASNSAYGEKERLFKSIADLLLENGSYIRACEFMESFASQGNVVRWITKNCISLFRHNCIFAPMRLAEISRRGATTTKAEVNMLRCLGSRYLGDESRALRSGMNFIKDSGAHLDNRLFIGCIIASLLITANNEENNPQVLDKLEVLSLEKSSSEDADDTSFWDISLLHQALELMILLNKDLDAGIDSLETVIEEGGKFVHSECEEGMVLPLLVCQCALDLAFDALNETADEKDTSDKCSKGKESDEPSKGHAESTICRKDIAVIVNFMGDCISVAAQSNKLDIFCLSASMSCDRMQKLYPDIELSLTNVVRSTLEIAQKVLIAQCSEWRRFRAEGVEKRIAYDESHPDVFRKMDRSINKALATRSNVPTLHVSLFGGMFVKIGDDVVNSSILNRKKNKLALALLVLNKGREISRDQIAITLWPESGMSAYRSNFYGLWSQLKHVLSVDGTCPYLIRTQTGCSIDKRYLETDVARFEDLCKSLLFGSDDPNEWEKLYTQVSEEFSQDLIPSEVDCDQIVLLRKKYREGLIDGLIATSKRLNNLGESRGALWFAREAVRRNEKREDSYIALMEAQIASEQRGAALETYFSCRKYLNEELGIDPSMRVIELYRSIIETEEVLF